MSLLNVNPVLLTWMPSGGEMIVLLLIIVVLFGGKKIPELARGLGKGIREFNDAKSNVKKASRYIEICPCTYAHKNF